MFDFVEYQQMLCLDGFSVVENIYTFDEIQNIITFMKDIDTSKDIFRKDKDLFAIRQFLKEFPEIYPFVFNDKLKNIIKDILGNNFFVVKSIYFDKPPTSNWYVPYHQDITISVDKKTNVLGFEHWTKKQNRFSVQPPVEILENIVTIRIHLDDTDQDNGALKVIPKSHLQKINTNKNLDCKTEFICGVKQGGIMLMKPLLWHGSNKTTNQKQRRVIHIEFSNIELPAELEWAEKINIDI